MHDGTNTERWNQAINKLIELTESGHLRWSERQLKPRPLMDSFVGPQFVAHHDSHQIAVYEYSFRTENDDYGQFVDSSPVVEFVDDLGDRMWVWPADGGRKWELLEAVRFQVSHAEGFLDTLLGSAPT